MNPSTSPTGPREGLSPRLGVDLLSDHHRRLEKKCRALLESDHTDNERDMTSSWCELEAELLDHIAAEEEVILPSYAVHAPDDARRILNEHIHVRALVSVVGVDVELHEIRLPHLRRLVEALETHSASEDAGMYPWAVEHVGLVSERLLFSRIQRWMART